MTEEPPIQQTVEMRRTHREEISRKVDFNVFVWVITILSGTMLAIASYLFTEVATVRTDAAENNAIIRGSIKELTIKIDAYQEKNTSVLIALAEIKGDIKNIRDKLDQRPLR